MRHKTKKNRCKYIHTPPPHHKQPKKTSSQNKHKNYTDARTHQKKKPNQTKMKGKKKSKQVQKESIAVQNCQILFNMIFTENTNKRTELHLQTSDQIYRTINDASLQNGRSLCIQKNNLITTMVLFDFTGSRS